MLAPVWKMNERPLAAVYYIRISREEYSVQIYMNALHNFEPGISFKRTTLYWT